MNLCMGTFKLLQSTFFSDIEQKAKDLTECEDINYKLKENTSKVVSMMISVVPALLTHFFESHMPSKKFKSQTFLVIIDS